ncbi:hypothetical protein CXF68_17380 [Tenacibaculum sp. Bg11-29]|uniref:hypothetical protein n=1 Tax=Tenacibaculum sp. Bg11-29 TaxID=2058306 RepID=UPI000C34F9D6|nr:hypothetical protein [Tenacibaculum sp. Bg11-29]PKH52359.1 hypothetical protein CXF68_17380 [Tenacibaculum sp. Bg11-29]
MKNIILFIIIIFLFSCREGTKEYFEGYVYYSNEPLIGVTITEGYSKPNDVLSVTDSLGYFKLKRFSQTFSDELIFSKKGFKTNTIKLLRGRHSPPLYTLFLREESDTLFMKKE